MMEALALWFALLTAADRIENPAPYEMAHFHYYDEQHKLHGVRMLHRVFVEGPVTKEFTEKLKVKDGVESVSVVKTSDRQGVMVFTKGKKETLEILNELVRGHKAYPVVMWEGVESIPLPEVLLQTTSPVTEILLRRRLNSLGKVQIETINNIDGNNYSIVFKETKIPSNVLVLANIVAQDTAWVKWCRPNFQPLIGKITASTFVTTPAETNLGEMRQYTIVVDVFVPGIKVRTDLLPTTPPVQQIEDIWLDANPPMVKEEKGLHKTTYIITYKFRLCRNHQASIAQFNLAYEEDKQAKTVLVPTVSFSTNSVLGEIDDIQAITQKNLLSEVSTPEVKVANKLPYVNLVGFVLLLLGGVVALGKAGGFAGSVANNWWLALSESRGKERLWKDLRKMSWNLDTNWQTYYHKVSKQMAKVLATFFDVHTPVSADSCVNLEVATIFRELEKLYQEKATPDVDTLSKAIRLFYKNRSLDV